MSDVGHKKGWAWFNLTTRETKRSDGTKYEIKGVLVWVKRSIPTASIQRVFHLF